MSDDFDKKNNGQDDTPPGDDEERFDWQTDDDGDNASSGDSESLGFTGMLSWLQDDDGDDESGTDDEETFDWQRDPSEAGTGGDEDSLGFTGTLSWNQEDDNEDDASTDDDLDFLSQFLDDDEPESTERPGELNVEPTGLTGLIDDDDPDDAFDFLNDLQDDEQRPGELNVEPTGLTGLIDDDNPDDDFDFLNDLQDDEQRPGELNVEPTGLTGLIDDDDPDDDFDFLNDLQDDEQRPGELNVEPTGLTGLIDDDDPDDDFDFLNDLQDDERPGELNVEPTGLTGLIDDDDSDDAFDFLNDLQDDERPGELNVEPTGLTGLIDDDDQGDAFDFLNDLQDDEQRPGELNVEPTGLTDLFGDEASEDELSWLSAGDDDAPASRPGELDAEPTGLTDLFGDESADEFDFLDDQPAARPGEPTGLTDLFGDEAPEDELSWLEGGDESELPLDDEISPGGGTPDADAFLASIMLDDDDQDDLFQFEDNSASTTLADDDLFSELDASDFEDEEEEISLEALLEAAEAEAPEAPPAQDAGFDDLESFLAGLDDTGSLPQSGQFTGEHGDFDLEDDEMFADVADRQQSTFSSLPDDIDAPDFLTNVAVGGTSASAIVRQQDNKPLDELDDRLFDLREQAEEISSAGTSSPGGSLEELLPGVTDVLPPASMDTERTDVTDSVRITDEQAGRADVLRSLLGSSEGTSDRALAISRTFDSPFERDDLDMSVFEDIGEEETKAEQKPRRRRRRRIRLRADRLLIALLLIIAVIAPFFGIGLLGDPPASEFEAEGAAAAAYVNVESVRPRELVLFAVEYGPTSAGDLDEVTEALFRHTLIKGGFPVIVGSNPVGLLRTENILNDLIEDESFTDALERVPAANQDYYIVRYLTGGPIALRSLANEPGPLLTTDVEGNPTGLSVTSLDEFGLIVILAERSEDIRFWSEQVAPLTNTQLIAGVSEATAPLAQPYLGAADGLDGLLVGFEDALTYNAILTDAGVLEDAVVLANVPTSTPTATPQPTFTPTLTPIGFVASETPPGFMPSATPEGFVPTVLFGIGSQVTSQSGPINVRSEPSVQGDIVATLNANELAFVLQEGQNGEWIQILLPDSSEGWVSADLLRLATDEELEIAAQAIAETPTEAPSATPTATATQAPTETEPPTATDAPTETDEPTETEPPTATEADVEAETTEAAEPTETAAAETDEAVEEPTDSPTATQTAAPTEVAAAAESAIEPGTVVVTTNRTAINVRSGPGTGFGRVTSLPPSTALSVIGTNDAGDWIQVSLPDGGEGWIFGDLATVDADADLPTAAPSATPTESPTEAQPPTDEPVVPLDLDGLVGTVNSRTGVNIRSGPGRGFNSVAVAQDGDMFNILDQSENGNWVQVALPDGGEGWISASLLEFDADATLEAPDDDESVEASSALGEPSAPGRTLLPANTTVRTRGRENLNVREEPGRFTPLVGVLRPGLEVPALELSADGDWIRVELEDGAQGWIRDNLLFLIEPEAKSIRPVMSRLRAAEPHRIRDVSQQQQRDGSGRINAEGTANVRGGPGLTFDVVGTVAPEEIVPVIQLGDGDSAGWVQIRLIDGTEGWISAGLIVVLEFPIQPPVEAITEEAATAEATAEATSEATAETQDAAITELDNTTARITGTNSVNVRSGPGLAFDSVGTAEPDARLAALAISENENWVQIQLPDGTEGWISASLVELSDEPAVVATAEVTQDPEPVDSETSDVTATITATGQANIRSGPGLIFNSVGDAAPDAVLPALAVSEDENWVQIRLPDGTEGWISASLVTLSGDFETTVVEEATPEAPQAEETAVVEDPESVPVASEPELIFPTLDTYATITESDAVAVRSGDDALFNAVGEVMSGIQVIVLGANDDESWLEIRQPDGIPGWIPSEATEVTGEIGAAGPRPFVENEANIARTVFAEANTDSDEIGELAPTAQAVVLQIDDEWLQIRTPEGRVGWIATQDVALEGDFADNPVPTATITTDNPLAARSGANDLFDEIGELEPEIQVDVLAVANGWAEVRLADGTPGWLPLDNIQINGEFTEPESIEVAEALEEEAAEEPESAEVPEAETETSTQTGPSFSIPTVSELDTSNERRFFGIRLGLLMAALVISLANIINIVRAIGRRRSR